MVSTAAAKKKRSGWERQVVRGCKKKIYIYMYIRQYIELISLKKRKIKKYEMRQRDACE